MTYEQAVEKAKANKGPAINIGQYESATALVGKKLNSPDPKNTNFAEVIDIVNGNYIVRINGGDYNTNAVALTLQNLHRMKVS